MDVVDVSRAKALKIHCPPSEEYLRKVSAIDAAVANNPPTSSRVGTAAIQQDLTTTGTEKLAHDVQVNVHNENVKLKDLIAERSRELALLLSKEPSHIPVAKQHLADIFARSGSVPARGEWSDLRFRKGRTPAEFLLEVYDQELSDKSLSLKLLRNLDQPLYQALYSWLGRDEKRMPAKLKYLFK